MTTWEYLQTWYFWVPFVGTVMLVVILAVVEARERRKWKDEDAEEDLNV